MKYFSRSLLSLAIAALSALSIAQTTNKATLLDIAERETLKATTKQRQAHFYARFRGIPTRVVEANGAIRELVEFRRGRPIYRVTDNTTAALSTRASRLQPGGSTGLNLFGAGVLVGIWDGGAVRTTHQEFGTRVTVSDGSTALSDHATHVAGTILAAGVNATAKGMAGAATGSSNDWNNDTGEMALAAANGLQLSNHSYGYIAGWHSSGGSWYWYGDVTVSTTEEVGFGAYESTATDWDNVLYNAPYYLAMKSAGNDRNQGPAAGTTHFYWDGTAWVTSTATRNIDGNGTGYDTISYYGVAKNMLTIGAVNDVPNYTGPASVTMSGFSGWGPTDDGRIKPDVVGNGVGLFSSTAGSNTSYASFSGTSMSSPNVTGTLALLVQHYRNLTGGQNMLATTLKALAIHTADECGANDGPDYAYGWGLVDAEDAANVITQDQTVNERITENTLSDGQTFSQSVYNDGTQPLKVTIVWAEPGATPPAWTLDNPASVLLNDLDLRVTGPGGVTMPWVLDPAVPNAAATKGDNFRDNVEQVVVPAPTAGSYTITVTHKGTTLAPVGSQNFSMIITGSQLQTSVTSLSLSSSTVASGGSATGTVTVNHTSGATVTLSDTLADATVPATVSIPSGSSSANFQIDAGMTLTPQSGTVTATVGSSSQSANLTITPYHYLSSFTLTPTQVPGGATLDGTVEISTNLGSLISFSSTSPYIIVPSPVEVQGGSTSANFVVQTRGVPTTTVATIVATDGYVSIPVEVTLEPGALVDVSASPASIPAGSSSTGTVNFSGAIPPAGIEIALSSNNPAVSVPSSIQLNEGDTSGTFAISTSSVSVPTDVTITATFNGGSVTTTVTVTPANAVVQSLSLSPTSLFEGFGGTGTVTLSGPAPTGGLTVSLSEVGSTKLNLPGSVTVAAGQTSATFSFSALTATSIANALCTVQASAPGGSATATVTVQTIRLNSLSFPSSRIRVGGTLTGTVTISQPAGPGGVVVQLRSSQSEVTVPSSVVVPAGRTSATFTVQASLRARGSATITASKLNDSKKSTLNVIR